MHHFLGQIFQLPLWQPLPPLDIQELPVELMVWQNLSGGAAGAAGAALDFVVAGTERCGSSSLHWNLFQHPATGTPSWLAHVGTTGVGTVGTLSNRLLIWVSKNTNVGWKFGS